MFDIDQNLLKAGLTPYLTTIDIESPDNRTTGQILTIGAVTVNIIDGTIASAFYARVTRAGQADLGMTESPSTLKWWDEVRLIDHNIHAWNEAFAEQPRLALDRALVALNAYLEHHYPNKKDAQVFGCGPEYDNVVLENAYNLTGIRMGWTFRGNQSIRTILLLSKIIFGGLPEHRGPSDIPHHALHDAYREAKAILRLLHHIDLHMEGV